MYIQLMQHSIRKNFITAHERFLDPGNVLLNIDFTDILLSFSAVLTPWLL